MKRTFEEVMQNRPNNFVNIWHFEGYSGFSDCDGSCDYNRHYVVAVDSRFSKEDVEAMFLEEFKKDRTVEFVLKLVGKMPIEIPITMEQDNMKGTE